MAATTLLPTPDRQHPHQHHSHRHRHKKLPPPVPQPKPSPPSPPVSSWEHFKSLLSCRSLSSVHIVAPSNGKPPISSRPVTTTGTGICGTSLCALRDVVHGNTRVVHRSDNTDSASAASVESVGSIGSAACKETAPLAGTARQRRHGHNQPHARSLNSGCGGSKGGGGMPLRGLTGCVECRAISVEPMSRRYPRPRALCVCPDCGEVFTKPESLEHHQAIRHAVSELGPEDSGRNIVEIIFKSSWQHQAHPRTHPVSPRPICHVGRILKVHNLPRTLARFEAHRAAVKSRSSARAAADGNELLRFLSAPISCALGLNGSNSLCGSSACGVCSAIRHGFTPPAQSGVRTTASSGCAHDAFSSSDNSAGLSRAMIVCRVIAGRVRCAGGGAEVGEEAEEYDSMASDTNLEEMFVMNPRAILPCFVVIYRTIN